MYPSIRNIINLAMVSITFHILTVPRSPLVDEQQYHDVPAPISYTCEDNSSSITEEHVPIGKKIASIFTHKSKEPFNETVVSISQYRLSLTLIIYCYIKSFILR